MDTYKNVMKNHILYSFAYGLGHKGIMLGKAWLNNRSNWYDVVYGWPTRLCQNCRGLISNPPPLATCLGCYCLLF